MHNVPTEIGCFVDSRIPPYVEDVSPTQVADFRLTYGQVSRHEVLEAVHEEVKAATYGYLSKLADFIKIGQPDVPLPEYAQFQAVDTISSHVDFGRNLSSWLDIAGKHDPEFAHQITAEVANYVISGFDITAYEAALEALPGTDSYALRRIRANLEYSGKTVAANITSLISNHSIGESVATEFLASDFFARFCENDVDLSLDVFRRIVEMKGYMTDGRYSSHFMQMIRFLESSLHRSKWSITAQASAALALTAECSPYLLRLLAEQHRSRGHEVYFRAPEYILNVNDSDRTPSHTIELKILVAKLSSTLEGFTHLLMNNLKRGSNSIEPDSIARLTDLLCETDLNSYGHMLERSSKHGAILLCTYAPDEDLPGIISALPELTDYEEVQSIAIRRLARIGEIQQAWGIARKELYYNDPKGFITNPIRNMLTIYEETGDVNALVQALHRIEYYKSRPKAADPIDLHEFAARRYVAVIKQGLNPHLEKAEMEIAHKNTDLTISGPALSLTLQMYLDLGEIETAEHYADELAQHPTFQEETGPAALLAVVNAYIQADRLYDAIQFIKPRLLDRQPLTRFALQAIACIATRGASFRTPSNARHLDPLHDELLK